jgi:hypothetical protein
MAWNRLDDIKTLHDSHVPWWMKVAIFVEMLFKKAIAGKAGAAYTPIKSLTFTGSPIVPVSSFKALLESDIVPQHVGDYLKLFGFPGLLSIKDKMMIGFAAGGLLLGTGVWSVQEEEGRAELTLSSIQP